MAPTLPSEDITKKFGLDPITESVQRLIQMIAMRDASTEDFAKLVSEDNELVGRLLRAASTPDYTATTVEEALQRTGMSSALLLPG
jgi:HD-like signal output (HDOD) protein